MGKVHDGIQLHSAALAQWVHRKLVNHDPMSVRDKSKKTARTYAGQRSAHEIGENVVNYRTDDGKEFRITVEQVAGEVEDSDDSKLTA